MTRNPLQKGHSRASTVTPSLSAFNTDNKKSRFAGILELSDGLDSCLRTLVRAAARREVCTRLVVSRGSPPGEPAATETEGCPSLYPTPNRSAAARRATLRSIASTTASQPTLATSPAQRSRSSSVLNDEPTADDELISYARASRNVTSRPRRSSHSFSLVARSPCCSVSCGTAWKRSVPWCAACRL